MNDNIEKSGSYINQTIFNFRFKYVVKYFNSSDETIDYGNDLKLFKDCYPKLKDNEIKNALIACISRKLIKHYSISNIRNNEEFCQVLLTEYGQGGAISNTLNYKIILERFFDFITENAKNLVTTILTSVVTTLITIYLTNLLTKK